MLTDPDQNLDKRQQQLTNWVSAQLMALKVAGDIQQLVVSPVSGDASFRRYFRASLNGETWIAVDAPPEKEDSHPFVAIADAWYALGINVPRVHKADFNQGFMLLSDFGDRLYLPALNENNADQLYDKAFDELIKIQTCNSVPGYTLPPYDQGRLLEEMQLCPDWFLRRQLRLDLSAEEAELLATTFDTLVSSALEQPQVCVHRDYHSRNLMLTAGPAPGVLDFQDAVTGPVTYDAVSLLRDCYINWPRPRIYQWLHTYYQKARVAGLIAEVEEDRFKRWFDLMGMQRHIKCVGIFSRLNMRDGKPGYLRDIPRTFNYILDVCAQYEEFAGFNNWLRQKVVSAMSKAGLT